MHYYSFYLATTLLATVLFSASSCEGNDPFIDTPEEEAARILANTPTELPPITTTGENTMGAWIIPQPGSELALEAGTDSILFVASGVERIDPIGASSTDCNAFQNYRYESQGYVSIRGVWCPRPEISMPEEQALQIRVHDWGTAVLRYSYDDNGSSSLHRLKYESDTIFRNSYNLSRDDVIERILSGQFNAKLGRTEAPFDTIIIRNGRLDVTYGSTP